MEMIHKGLNAKNTCLYTRSVALSPGRAPYINGFAEMVAIDSAFMHALALVLVCDLGLAHEDKAVATGAVLVLVLQAASAMLVRMLVLLQ